MQRFRSTRAVINLKNLSHNVRQLRSQLQPGTFFCPMVKANAYGHGDVQIARQLEKEGVQFLGVGLIEEGILLRDAGIQTDILFFGTFENSVGAQAVIDHRLTPVLSTWEQLHLLREIAPVGYGVHVKFDTGMHRLGFDLKDLSKVVDFFRSSKLKVQGILTHLHSAEDANDVNGSSFEQLRKFQDVERAFREFSPLSHTLNSAGFLNFLSYRGKTLPHQISATQGVRPGLAIYGISPLTNQPTNQLTNNALNLKPVMSLRSQTVKYHRVPKGEGASYNTTWKASQDSVVEVIPMGYADGYHRALSNRAEILFRGQKVAQVGNVCMDYILADITATVRGEKVEDLKSEDVILFGADEQGHEISVSELARKAQTIPWEILTSMSERVPREVIA